MSLSDKTGTFVEIFGQKDNGEVENIVDYGFTCLISPLLQIDISFGHSLTKTYNYYSVGISWRIDE
jgi:hypothetical protein